jgi:Cu(I)/Ag(I) efflux system periplasmic protein CusF
VVDAEVRKIDAEQQKITLRHGEIANLDMSPMTMVFQAQDPALLQKVKPGDKVRFTADKLGGTLTVLSLEPANRASGCGAPAPEALRVEGRQRRLRRLAGEQLRRQSAGAG